MREANRFDISQTAQEHREQAYRRQWRRTLEGPLRARFDAFRVTRARIEDAASDGVLILFAMLMLGALSVIMAETEPAGSSGGTLFALQVLAAMVVAGIAVALMVGLRVDILMAKCGYAVWHRLRPVPALSRQDIEDWRASLPALTKEGAASLLVLLEDGRDLDDIRAWIEAEAGRRAQEALAADRETKVQGVLERAHAAHVHAHTRAMNDAAPKATS